MKNEALRRQTIFCVSIIIVNNRRFEFFLTNNKTYLQNAFAFPKEKNSKYYSKIHLENENSRKITGKKGHSTLLTLL